MSDEVLFVVQDCFGIKGRGTVLTAQVSGETERRLVKALKIVLRIASRGSRANSKLAVTGLR